MAERGGRGGNQCIVWGAGAAPMASHLSADVEDFKSPCLALANNKNALYAHSKPVKPTRDMFLVYQG